MPKIKSIFDYRALRIYLIVKTILDVATIVSKLFDIGPLNQVSWIVTIYTIVPIILCIVFFAIKRADVISDLTIVLLFSNKKKTRNIFRLLSASIFLTLLISRLLGDNIGELQMGIFLLVIILWELMFRKKTLNRYFIFVPEKKERLIE